MSEIHLTRDIITAINASGLAFVWRNQSGMVKVNGAYMHLAPKGSPDIVGWLLNGTGRFVGLEVKLPGEKPTEVQLEWQTKMTSDRCICSVVTSVKEAIGLLK